MKLLERLSNMQNRVTRNKGNGRVAVVHWDRETIFFLLVSLKSRTITEADIGAIVHVDAGNPLLALANHFRDHSIFC